MNIAFKVTRSHLSLISSYKSSLNTIVRAVFSDTRLLLRGLTGGLADHWSFVSDGAQTFSHVPSYQPVIPSHTPCIGACFLLHLPLSSQTSSSTIFQRLPSSRFGPFRLSCLSVKPFSLFWLVWRPGSFSSPYFSRICWFLFLFLLLFLMGGVKLIVIEAKCFDFILKDGGNAFFFQIMKRG